MQSYLSDRSFRVNIKSKYSSTGKIECGVPQGSILESLLFLLYVNDMKQAVIVTDFCMQMTLV